ncbi:hypothetical protein TNCV_2987411 [Trichonephila clavipes]|nr:hypothetical protein TNCV_2987411 [Trichonephila clavipes]
MTLEVREYQRKEDGVPDVRAYLGNAAPGLWIGQRDPIEYPTHSPDLPPLDFYLWSYLKNVVYNKKSLTLEEFRYEIVTANHAIPVATLRGVIKIYGIVVKNIWRSCFEINSCHHTALECDEQFPMALNLPWSYHVERSDTPPTITRKCE